MGHAARAENDFPDQESSFSDQDGSNPDQENDFPDQEWSNPDQENDFLDRDWSNPCQERSNFDQDWSGLDQERSIPCQDGSIPCQDGSILNQEWSKPCQQHASRHDSKTMAAKPERCRRMPAPWRRRLVAIGCLRRLAAGWGGHLSVREQSGDEASPTPFCDGGVAATRRPLNCIGPAKSHADDANVHVMKFVICLGWGIRMVILKEQPKNCSFARGRRFSV